MRTVERDMTERTGIAAARADASHVDVTWNPGGDRTRLYSYWLKLYGEGSREYAGIADRWTDGANFHPREVRIAPDDRIDRARAVEGGTALEVVWNDGTAHVFPAQWLRENTLHFDPAAEVEPILWDSRGEFPRFGFDELMDPGDDETLLRFLEGFLAYGMVFVDGVPKESGQITRVAARISTLQRTHLGEFFTLRSVGAGGAGSKHIGETSDEIPLHIDLVYKQKPPDLQMLHALHQIERGGENIFVDALHIARQLDPADLALLRDVPVYFVAKSESVHFRGLHPILAYDSLGKFRGVHYNEYKIIFPPSAPNEYFFAFKHFQELIRREENVRTVLLPEDSIVLFHNLRTLHGRRAFRAQERHYEGCFVSEDDLKSRYRVLKAAARVPTPQSRG